MSYYIKQELLAGSYEYAWGSTPSGKNFANRTEVVKPPVDRRPRPADVSKFSLASTSRTYFTRTTQFSTMGSRPLWQGVERLPVGWIAGGLSAPEPTAPDFHTRIALKVKNQKANLGITLAQYRQLTTLFTGFSSDILRTAASLQRLRRPRNWLRYYKTKRLHRDVHDITNSAAKVYLGYLFGVSQFKSDFMAVSNALRRRFEDPMYLEDWFNIYQSSELSSSGGTHPNTWISQSNLIIKHRVKLRYRVFPNDQVLSQMGVQVEAVPSVLYDAVPFSFVLDWIIPIGRYLRTLDALNGVSDLRWYFTRQRVAQRWNEYPEWRGHSVHTAEEVSRSAVQTQVSPPLPKFGFSTYANNVGTAVALLVALQKKPQIADAVILLR